MDIFDYTSMQGLNRKQAQSYAHRGGVGIHLSYQSELQDGLAAFFLAASWRIYDFRASPGLNPSPMETTMVVMGESVPCPHTKVTTLIVFNFSLF